MGSGGDRIVSINTWLSGQMVNIEAKNPNETQINVRSADCTMALFLFCYLSTTIAALKYEIQWQLFY